MRLAIALAVLAVAAKPAMANDSQTTAIQLGSVLAGEDFCGLSYDQAAIRSYIEKNVRADDMSFPNDLQTMTSAGELDNKDLSPSSKTAHCTQIARIAKSYGFTK